jgi:hypothetical protein
MVVHEQTATHIGGWTSRASKRLSSLRNQVRDRSNGEEISADNAERLMELERRGRKEQRQLMIM